MIIPTNIQAFRISQTKKSVDEKLKSLKFIYETSLFLTGRLRIDDFFIRLQNDPALTLKSELE